MTDRIRKLDPRVAIQIAAGEVVTRPSSVAKELLENAIDAGAARVRVEVDGGGVERLAIVDDGRGMSRADATACIERHATSKLREVDELSALATFGFRGEALPSIASVSRLRIQTRMTGDDEGTEVRIDGGGEPEVRPCGCAVGTTVEVRDLFYNVPARRKFLRATSTEGAHVSEVLKAVALAHPNVQFELRRGGRRAQRYLATDDRGTRTREVLDGYPLVDASGRRSGIEVEAYLSPPDRSRSGTGGLHLFVLGRPVKDRNLARAVAQAYAGALTSGRYPVGALFITVPRDEVDINVHPQKSEVRFARERDVVDAVFRIVGDTIAPRFVGTRSAQELAADRQPTRHRASSWSRERSDKPPADEAEWSHDGAEESATKQASPPTAKASAHAVQLSLTEPPAKSQPAPLLDAQPTSVRQQVGPAPAAPHPPASPPPPSSSAARPASSPPARATPFPPSAQSSTSPPSAESSASPPSAESSASPPSAEPSASLPSAEPSASLPFSSRAAPTVPLAETAIAAASSSPSHRWLATEQGLIIAIGPKGLRLIPRRVAVARWFTVRATHQLEQSGALSSKALTSPTVLRRNAALCDRVGDSGVLATAKQLGLIVSRSGASTMTVMAIPELLYGLQVEPLVDTVIQLAIRRTPAEECVETLARYAARAKVPAQTFDARVLGHLEQLALIDEVTAQLVPLPPP